MALQRGPARRSDADDTANAAARLSINARQECERAERGVARCCRGVGQQRSRRRRRRRVAARHQCTARDRSPVSVVRSAAASAAAAHVAAVVRIAKRFIDATGIKTNKYLHRTRNRINATR